MDHSAAHPPQAVLLQMLMGPWVAQALGAVARLGVADHLTGGPKSSAELAELGGADADALGRTLRALSTVGVFSRTRRFFSKSQSPRVTLRVRICCSIVSLRMASNASA